MRHTMWGMWVVLCLLGCGGESKVDSASVSGAGVVEVYSSIEFVGIVLNDKNNHRLYDLSDQPFERKAIGARVSYAGTVDTSWARPAGVPDKVNFSKYEIIGGDGPMGPSFRTTF